MLLLNPLEEPLIPMVRLAVAVRSARAEAATMIIDMRHPRPNTRQISPPPPCGFLALLIAAAPAAARTGSRATVSGLDRDQAVHWDTGTCQETPPRLGTPTMTG